MRQMQRARADAVGQRFLAADDVQQDKIHLPSRIAL
jgi:hypothetical protein